MVIKKILNNNVVISENDQNEEIVIMGRGLAFGKKCGEVIDETKVDKTFTLGNGNEKFLQKYLGDLDMQYFGFCQELVDYAKMELGKKLNNSVYITLTDHINTMVERAKIGAYVKNTMLWDIKRMYRDEFRVGMEMVKRFNEKFGASFGEDEAANLAIHLVNAELDGNMEEMFDITKAMSEILNIVKYFFKIEYNTESLGYYRFVTHLKFFVQRIFTHNAYDGTDDAELFEVIQLKYPEIFDCTKVIKEYLKKQYSYVLEDEECLYLTLHIAKVVRESKKI